MMFSYADTVTLALKPFSLSPKNFHAQRTQYKHLCQVAILLIRHVYLLAASLLFFLYGATP